MKIANALCIPITSISISILDRKHRKNNSRSPIVYRTENDDDDNRYECKIH